MDEDEDFKALFFSEARELLEALLEHLNLLADDDGDGETVHAAFRAVHSVKGGAAAFGFDTLIGFAHIFETVMDRIREGSLELDDHVAQIPLRSGDMMQVLVEKAEAGEESEVDGMRRLQQELDTLAGVDSEDALESDAAETAASDAETEDTAPADDDDPDTPAMIELICRMASEKEFFEAGHDMLRLIRSARDLGLAEVHTEGDVLSLDTFDPRSCPLSWELVFRTERSASVIEDFFSIYAHMAQFDFYRPTAEDDAADPGPVPATESRTMMHRPQMRAGARARTRSRRMRRAANTIAAPPTCRSRCGSRSPASTGW